MRTRQPAPVCPDEVRNEVLLPQRGDTRYWLCLGDEHVELLALGFCPEDVARQAFDMLEWKRQVYRREAREKSKEIA